MRRESQRARRSQKTVDKDWRSVGNQGRMLGGNMSGVWSVDGVWGRQREYERRQVRGNGRDGGGRVGRRGGGGKDNQWGV